jgi:hypothetical protein
MVNETHVTIERAVSISGLATQHIERLCSKGILTCVTKDGVRMVEVAGLEKCTAQKKMNPSGNGDTEDSSEEALVMDGVKYVSLNRASRLTGYPELDIVELAESPEILKKYFGERLFVGLESLFIYRRTEHVQHVLPNNVPEHIDEPVVSATRTSLNEALSISAASLKKNTVEEAVSISKNEAHMQPAESSVSYVVPTVVQQQNISEPSVRPQPSTEVVPPLQSVHSANIPKTSQKESIKILRVTDLEDSDTHESITSFSAKIAPVRRMQKSEEIYVGAAYEQDTEQNFLPHIPEKEAQPVVKNSVEISSIPLLRDAYIPKRDRTLHRTITKDSVFMHQPEGREEASSLLRNIVFSLAAVLTLLVLFVLSIMFVYTTDSAEHSRILGPILKATTSSIQYYSH